MVMGKFPERRIGDKFELNGRTFVVVKDDPQGYNHPCQPCAFNIGYCIKNRAVSGFCAESLRKDKKSVHFEVVKAGA